MKKLNFDEIKKDVTRYFGVFSWKKLIFGFLFNRTFRPIVTLRLCQQADVAGWVVFLFIFKIIHGVVCHAASVDLPWRTSIGAGLKIDHGRGLVVNKNAVIGSNVTILHGVTIGQKDKILADGVRVSSYPKVEDLVWIGPNAIIVGGVTIGKGSRVAGGAFVYEDVPKYSIVAGNPGKVVSSNCIPDVINRA